ncbi:MAG: hypothetical protein JNJ57_03685, partial [Saprospiraceae bacterium]|nr:hypothetical protein [Saprospiraceae bacterium]
MLVDRIQLRLQQFVADAGYEKVFSEFDSILRNDPNNPLRKDAALIQGSYKDIVRDFAVSILSLEERDQRLAKLRSALLELINRITLDDLNDAYRS